MNHREVMQQALEALDFTDSEPGSIAWEREKDACEALRTALAEPVQEPVQEPVATLHDDGCFTWKRDEFRRCYDSQRAGWRMDVFAARSMK